MMESGTGHTGTRKHRQTSTLVTAALAACVATGAATPALAQKTIQLTAIDGYPPRSLWVKTFIEFFIPVVAPV
jgi:hypothetical protein